MGTAILVEFEKTPESIFYACRKCQAHIAQHIDLTTADELNGLFQNVVNVHTLGPEHNRKDEDDHLVEADAYCNNCDELLGTKIIEVLNGDALYDVGDHLLLRQKLLRWDETEFVDP